MPLFFVQENMNLDDVIEITGEDAHHIANVLRMGKGDDLQISNGRDTVCKAQIVEVLFGGKKIKVKIIEKNNFEMRGPRITLFQGVPKGQKFDFILQKNTELGVAEFVPVITKRTVVEIDRKKMKSRTERWQKIVKEAAKQCRRPDLPKVHGPVDFDECVAALKKYPLVLVPWEEERKIFLKPFLSSFSEKIREIAVLIGPEGGFSEDEIKKARESGAVTVSLGKRILRTETAGFAVNTVLMYEFGDFGEVVE
ncbi:Ribosomal RNA small subunit methyltransferase E [Fervidicola ferrireducens]|uniref:Ribosomal RNA small subunit methyltransferase E n=1 Tax=Fervidicola ferrireducens TaxID=520764 RepID=A0A140LD93_9FIRM|nr:Ribosomal RNA small subunit methyltransferase E [Fervidicola ferrireducens]